MTAARADGKALPKSDQPMHQLDASKNLSCLFAWDEVVFDLWPEGLNLSSTISGKPLGKPRVKPWVNIAKSHGPGGGAESFCKKLS